MANGPIKKVSFKRSDAVIPLPEALTAFRQDADSSVRVKWEIQETLTPEETSVDFSTHTFRTTVLRDEASKFYRNRENVRVRIGFNNPGEFARVAKDFLPGVLQSAEELRITRVTKLLGFNTDVLKNGSEKKLGERLAEDGTGNAWNILVTYGLSLVGTKAFNSLLVGVRRHQEDWAEQLRNMSNEVLEFLNNYTSLPYLTDTRSFSFEFPKSEGIYFAPCGFANSLAVSNIAEKYMLSPDEVGSPGGGPEVDDGGVGIGFAPLIIDESIKLTKTVQKSLMRKYKSDSLGTDIRYPERLLTDPHRRIFGRKKPLVGGIVLIDTSGSMSLESWEVQAILDAAPGALVMAYSHLSSSKRRPNLFILADRGKQVRSIDEVSYTNGGNGVDGPALQYAVKRRLRKEPIIWVCDGMVTGADDRRTTELSEYCARLVARHNITTAYKVEDAIQMLRTKKFVSKRTHLSPYIEAAKRERKGF